MGPAAEPSSSEKRSAYSNDAIDFDKFDERVRRSVVLEEVTPHVNIPMIQTALGQFGTVVSVDILANPLESKLAAKRAIVEMESQKDAAYALKEIQEHPFMIKGVPRPVRATAAVHTLFPERPRKGSLSKLAWEWVEPGHPDFAAANELKRMAKRHAAESAYLMQQLRKDEEKLAQEQEEKVKENIKKLDEIINCAKDNTIQRLSRYYGLKYDGGTGIG